MNTLPNVKTALGFLDGLVEILFTMFVFLKATLQLLAVLLKFLVLSHFGSQSLIFTLQF